MNITVFTPILPNNILIKRGMNEGFIFFYSNLLSIYNTRRVLKNT